MSTEQNKVLFRRLIEELLGQGNLAAADELIAADVIEHEELAAGSQGGREGIKAAVTMFRNAFPNLRVTIEDMFSEGDKVVARNTWQGSHQGELMGIPPTGKFVTFAAWDIVRIKEAKIVEHWGLTDIMSLMQQLGVVPEPDTAGI